MLKALVYIASVSLSTTNCFWWWQIPQILKYLKWYFQKWKEAPENTYFWKYCFLFFPERYTAIQETKKKLHIRPHRNDDTRLTKVNGTGKRKTIPLFFQFYKLLIWDSHRRELLCSEGITSQFLCQLYTASLLLSFPTGWRRTLKSLYVTKK